jgi:acyl-CoA reductase-like NAD-dependent aldehyde dehydrogenase
MAYNKSSNSSSVTGTAVPQRAVERITRIPPSTIEEMDAALDTLQSKKEQWARLNIDEKITILDEVVRDFQTVDVEWVTAGMQAKGHEENSFGEGEEWFFVFFIYNLLKVLKNSLRDIKRFGRPRIPGGLSKHPNGQVVAHVYPQTLLDRLLFIGSRAEVWMQPGMSSKEVILGQAAFYQQDDPPGVVTLVLGAGNAPFLVPGDFLYKLYVEGHVVALKMNPANEYLGPIIEKGFQSLISRGYMGILYGGAEQGAYLSSHPDVDELHMTGSHHTYEAIVFGPGEQGKQRKAANNPILRKRFTSELGNITPVIVVPGDWNDADVHTQAVKIATWLVYNSGFACPTPRLIVQSKKWPLRKALNQAISEVFSRVRCRNAFYPGSHAIHAQFVAAHPEAEQYGGEPEGHLPWTFIPGVDPNNTDDIVFQTEPFCSLISETPIEGDTVTEFLSNAVSFLNENVWGTLAASIIVHPRSMRDPEVKNSVERAVADLHYGIIAINQYPAISYCTGTTTWGSYPGNDVSNIQSGQGVTNNYLMFARPQKSVLWAPFSIPFDPFSAFNKRVAEFGKKVASLKTKPAFWKLPGIYWTVLRGYENYQW